MAKSTKTTPSEPTEQVAEMMAEWQRMGFGALNTLGAGWAEAMADMGSEWLHFVSDRVQRDVEFQHRLLHAKSSRDIREAQSEFFQKAVDDYTAQTGRVMAATEKLLKPT